MSDQTLTVGRIVHYRLSEDDGYQVNRRRTSGAAIAERLPLGTWPTGAQAHIGNFVFTGDTFPMVIVRVDPDKGVNGQVFLDGTDVLWVSMVSEGDAPGTWQWPPRV